MSILQKLNKKIFEKFIGSNSISDRHLYSDFSFSKYIRPSIYKEDHIWQTNDDEYAWICEIAPRIKMGSETAEVFEQLLDKIPTNCFLQVILFGSKNIEPYLYEYEKEHTKVGTDIAINAVKNFTNFYRKKTNERINAQFSTQVKNNRAIFVIKSSNLNLLKKAKNDAFNALESNNFYPTTLEPMELKIIMSEMVNPNHDVREVAQYDERKFFNTQIMANDNEIEVKKDHLIIDNKYYKALTPVRYPKYAHIAEFGLKLGDYITQGMNSNQFVDNFFITLNLVRVEDSETSAIKRNKKIVKGGGTSSSKVKKEKSEIDNIVDNIDDRLPIFKVDMNIWVSGKELEEVKANADRIKSFWQKKTQKGEEEIGGIVLEEFTHSLLPLFIGSLPAGPNREYYKLITKSNNENHFSKEVVQFLPLEADYSGNYPHLLFASRRAQLCGVDIFKSDYSKNAFIVAQAGAGKSVLANYIAFQEYCRKNRVFVIDIGESYKKLCEEAKGEYISIDLNHPISFNPFHGLQITWNHYKNNKNSLSEKELKDISEEILEQKEFLSDFIYMIGANLSVLKAQEEQKYIKGILQDVIGHLLDTQQEIIEINDLQKYIIENYEDTRLQDFAVHLKPWVKGGSYYPFVAGASTINLNKPMVVLDLSSVEQKADIRDALIFIMTANISSFIYNNHDFSLGYQVIIDEAHKFLGKNLTMDAFFDQAYRRYRKHNASIIVITQSFEDIYNLKTGGLSIAGQAIMANAPWRFFLNQNETAINAIVESKLFTLSELDLELLKSTRSRKGFFSEIFLFNPQNEKTVLRLLIDRYFYYLTSSDPADKDKINKIMNKYKCSTGDAINYLIKEEEENAA